MSQLSLFDVAARPVMDDELGVITYHPAVIAPAVAGQWFAALLRDVPWREGQRQMYERHVAIPRLRGHFTRDDPELPAALREALPVACTVAHARFNSIGLNFYRDERDSVAPHNDKLDDLVRGAPIAVLSLGATREMIIRQKKNPHRKLRLSLEAGSMLIMSWTTQLHYDHGIPKQRQPCGPRISVAFRVRPQ